MQLVADAIQVRLGRNCQWRRRQVSVTQRQHLGQQRIGPPVGGGVTQLDQGMQATAHRSPRNFRAVADLRDGQVALAFLKRLDHRQAAGQRGHEVGITGEGLDTPGR
ncbi:hypothetical protein D9M73_162250 [compost metagenome]